MKTLVLLLTLSIQSSIALAEPSLTEPEFEARIKKMEAIDVRAKRIQDYKKSLVMPHGVSGFQRSEQSLEVPELHGDGISGGLLLLSFGLCAMLADRKRTNAL